MIFFSALVTVLGLAIFETVSSIDNAVINAEVLQTMGAKARKLFLTWGLFFAVFMVRGLLPWFIVWGSAPDLGFFGSLTATFSNDPQVIEIIERAAPILLLGGGTFLLFLFFHWWFVEPKNYGLRGERFVHDQAIWFYAVVSLLLTFLVWQGLHVSDNNLLAFGAVIGSTAFFITHGFKERAEEAEKDLMKEGSMSDMSKIMYLEVIDTTFSIDGVLGAFAFTMSIPLIILGSGIGAVVVRQLTIGNIERIKKYKFLKNGAMYSIFFLGLFMVMESFGAHIEPWVSPVVTCLIIGYFVWLSRKEWQKEGA